MGRRCNLCNIIVVLGVFLGILGSCSTGVNSQILLSSHKLKMFVDEIPNIPKVYGYEVVDGKAVSTSLTIGMFQKFWVSS